MPPIIWTNVPPEPGIIGPGGMNLHAPLGLDRALAVAISIVKNPFVDFQLMHVITCLSEFKVSFTHE